MCGPQVFWWGLFLAFPPRPLPFKNMVTHKYVLLNGPLVTVVVEWGHYLELLWPLDVPAEVGHLHVAPDHEGAGQVEAAFRVGSDQLVVFTEGVAEHLIQSRGHREKKVKLWQTLCGLS